MGTEEQRVDATRNLVGTGCPMNLVYAKVALAGLQAGQVLEMYLDDGAPVSNVTRSLQEQGHHIISSRQRPDTSWRLVVRKG